MNKELPHTQYILLVDDDSDVLAALSGTLQRADYSLICCTSAEEALGQLERHAFAAVISDQHMPGMNGLQLLERVRTAQPDASRLLITGMLQVDTLIEAINSGEIFRFIAKPWSRGEVVATVENAVQRYELLLENRRLQAATQELNVQLALANERLQHNLEVVTEQKESIDRAHDALRQNFEHSLGLCFRLISTFYPLLGKQAQAVV